MDSDSARQYPLPILVSEETATHYRQFRNSSSIASPLESIPESHDLLRIQADLENLLPLSEVRLRHLRKDLNHLEKNVNVCDAGSESKSAGKNVNVMYEKLKMKQGEANGEDSLLGKETNEEGRNHSDNAKRCVAYPQLDESTETLTPPNKVQAALETLRRRHRREDPGKLPEGRASIRSESSQSKWKKLNHGHTQGSQSMSPPATASHSAKPAKTMYMKKKKSDVGSKTVTSHGAARAHQQQPNGKAEEDVGIVRVKPKDQVAVTTFWSAVDPCFRPLTEEDRNFLLEKGDSVNPFLIPPLGRHYLDVWADEERHLPALSRPHSPAEASSTTSSRQSSHDHLANSDGQERLKYLGPQYLTDDHLYTEDLSCGSLTERLLSCLVREDVMDIAEFTDGEDPVEVKSELDNLEGKTIMEMSFDPPDEVVEFEERLKRELRYAGLLGDDDIDWNAREDDEICAELRKTARLLKDQMKTNEFRKKRLLDVVDRQLQYQEYRHMLDILDTQVEQCYIKRFRNQKAKKRKTTAGPRSTLSENAVSAMVKRKTWVDALGGIFEDKDLSMPATSIYEDPTPSTCNLLPSALSSQNFS
ncbi:Transcriptional regulator [Apophysomyces sp. BC1015]|nr:Transcriptional regulator [Apophysomyces sp. BC1015]KAG0182049.1 Transcriptional regulator [Apophysomyces sp. BC1021]